MKFQRSRFTTTAVLTAVVAAVLLALPLRVTNVTDAGAHASSAVDANATNPPPAWPNRTIASGRYFHASPIGTAANPGTPDRPLDLAAALSANSPLRGGDVLWLRGGVYRGNYRSELRGRPDAYIVVAGYPGERAVLDGVVASHLPVLRTEGSHTVYWGFEVTNSSPRTLGVARGTGVDVFGPDTKLINLIVHDTGTGVGLWTPALRAEVYGNVIARSGWDAADRGHGHSIYVQNDSPAKRLVDNILFDGHSFGIHGYTQGGRINNLHIEGNIAFDHGSRSRVSGPKANILVGGWRVAEHPTLVANHAYYPAGSKGRNADVGYIAGCSDATIARNYLAGGVPILITGCDVTRMRGNTFVGPTAPRVAARFPDNAYTAVNPGESRTFVRANRYESGRAHIAVFNWQRRPSLPVDLSAIGLRKGQRFEIRDVRNFFGTPLAAGAFDRPILELPLQAMTAGPSEGGSNAGTAPEFGAAVVIPVSDDPAAHLPWLRRP